MLHLKNFLCHHGGISLADTRHLLSTQKCCQMSAFVGKVTELLRFASPKVLWAWVDQLTCTCISQLLSQSSFKLSAIHPFSLSPDSNARPVTKTAHFFNECPILRASEGPPCNHIFLHQILQDHGQRTQCR